MKSIQTAALIVMAAFYTAYFSKMISQRRKGVRTDHIGKGVKPKKALLVERLMKAAAYSIVPVEAVSIICGLRIWSGMFCWIGIGAAAAGAAVFAAAILTMRDSWRAGIPENDKTGLVTTGIYRFSRNPAFLGFDLMYIGLLIAFFNFVHLAFVVYAVTMLHLQIVQEEEFLATAFGERYIMYKKRVGRYFIL